jgi:hypothetical protein
MRPRRTAPPRPWPSRRQRRCRTWRGWRRARWPSRSAAPIIAHLDGHKPLAAIAEAVRMDWLAFSTLFAPVHTHLTGFNLLRYSKSLR